MTATFTVPADQLDQLRAGDRITAIDGRPARRVHTVKRELAPVHPAGPAAVELVNPLGTATVWNLYPGQVDREVTVERPAPPAPRVTMAPARRPAVAPQWDARERAAIRRSRHYADLLAALDQPGPVDLRAVTRGRFEARQLSHTAGVVATFYGWTERVRPYTWRLTDRGRAVLAAWRASA